MMCGLLVAACAKHEDNKASPGSNPEPNAAPGAAATPAAPHAGATKKVVLETLAIEVDAPTCAEVTPIDPSVASVSPDLPTCAIPFPGAVFSKLAAELEPSSLVDEIKNAQADTRKPEITRKETLPTGWAIEWKTLATADSPAEVGIKAHYKIDGAVITCQWHGSEPDRADVIWRICASAHKKA